MFFMNDKTATDTLNEGICFGIGETRYSDKQEKVGDYHDRLDEKEKVNEDYI